MFIADGAPYIDRHETGIPVGVRAVAVGWLDPGHPFSTGPVDEAFISDLFFACVRHASARTRGWHRCGFCPQPAALRPPGGVEVVRGAQLVTVGDAEIRVIAHDRTWLVAPTLILHYVVEHAYRPPDQFIEAVLRGTFV